MSTPSHRTSPSASERVAVVVAASAMLLVASCLAGCGGGDTAGSPSSAGGSTAAVSSTTTNAPPTPSAPPTTVVVTAMVFASPKVAADLLFAAWTSGDRSAADAAHWALPAELDELFGAAAVAAPKNRGCDEGLGGMSQCFVANGNGGIDIDLVAAPGGWTVQSITAFTGG